MPTNIAVAAILLSLLVFQQQTFAQNPSTPSTPASTATFTTRGCGTTKQCIFKPENCKPYVDCAYAFSYRRNGDYLIFELLGQVKSANSSYIAVGFSNDDVMGRDSVLVCGAEESDGNYTGRLGYNPGKSNRPIFTQPELMAQMVQTLATNYTNGTLYCSLSRRIVPVEGLNTNEVFDLSEPKYILLASGLIERTYTRIHDLDPDRSTFPYVSPQPVDLIASPRTKRQSLNLQPTQDYQPSNANAGTPNNITGRQIFQQPQNPGQPFQPPQNVIVDPQAKYRSDLLKVHAILMIIGWVFFLPNGIMFGTFFKYHWPNSYIFNKNIWFQFHRVLNLIGIACTIAAFVCIFVRENWEWIGPSPTRTSFQNNQWNSVHAMLGLLACVVAWAQPLNAVFRCHPTSAFRWIFKLYHGFFGLGALLMATAAIMIACKHFTSVFTNADAALGIFIAYVAVLGAVFLLLCILDLVQWGRKKRGVVASDLEHVEVDGKRHVTLTPETIRMHRIYVVFLLFFTSVSIGATIAISILIGLRKVQTFPQ